MKKIIAMCALVVSLSVVGKLIFAADSAPAAAGGDKAGATYSAKCASCHGKDGKGNPAMAKAFKVEIAALDLTSKAVQDKKDEELTALTTNGKGKMPAYKGKISDAEIAGLTAHIRSFVKK